MKIEHFALNVPDPEAMAAWYVEYLGMEVVRAEQDEPYMHFLRDSSGTVLLEFYKNPPDEVPDYDGMNPLQMHLAFVSADPERDKKVLIDAGARFVETKHLSDGSELVMLKDPWGISIQLCQRGNPMLESQSG